MSVMEPQQLLLHQASRDEFQTALAQVITTPHKHPGPALQGFHPICIFSPVPTTFAGPEVAGGNGDNSNIHWGVLARKAEIFPLSWM